MKLEYAKLICVALDDQGAEYTLDPEYSGRGMYDKTTAAIVVGDIGTFIGAVALAAANIDDDPGPFAEVMSRVRWDSMGRSDIVVY